MIKRILIAAILLSCASVEAHIGAMLTTKGQGIFWSVSQNLRLFGLKEGDDFLSGAKVRVRLPDKRLKLYVGAAFYETKSWDHPYRLRYRQICYTDSWGRYRCRKHRIRKSPKNRRIDSLLALEKKMGSNVRLGLLARKSAVSGYILLGF